jgi:hypothetical protein
VPRERADWFWTEASLEHAGELADTAAERRTYAVYLAWLEPPLIGIVHWVDQGILSAARLAARECSNKTQAVKTMRSYQATASPPDQASASGGKLSNGVTGSMKSHAIAPTP